MTESKSKRTNVAAFLAILFVSAVTMIVLFWHFPLTMALITVGVIALLGVSARLARSIEVVEADNKHGEPSL